MFTRTITLSKSGIVAAIISLSIASLAHAADITKCRDADGLIVYSNTPSASNSSCSDAVAVGAVADEAVESVSPSAQVQTNSISANDRGQIRETAWTHRNIPASKKALDKSTIRDARQALIESDRAMASLRQQTLAAND